MPLQYLRAGLVKRIHVNRQIVARNRKTGANDPAITVQARGGPYKARSVTVLGHGTMVQAGPEYSEVDGQLIRVIKPLSCGARLWYETKAAVEVIA